MLLFAYFLFKKFLKVYELDTNERTSHHHHHHFAVMQINEHVIAFIKERLL